jgi:hypothetical protein
LSSRSAIKGKEFRHALVEDPTLLLCAIIKSMLGSWLSVSEAFDTFERRVFGEHEIARTKLYGNEYVLSRMDHHEVLKASLDDLTQSAQALQCGGCATVRCKEGTQARSIMKDLAADLDHLINHTQRQLATIHQHVSLLASIRSIQEAEQSNSFGSAS